MSSGASAFASKTQPLQNCSHRFSISPLREQCFLEEPLHFLAVSTAREQAFKVPNHFDNQLKELYSGSQVTRKPCSLKLKAELLKNASQLYQTRADEETHPAIRFFLMREIFKTTLRLHDEDTAAQLIDVTLELGREAAALAETSEEHLAWTNEILSEKDLLFPPFTQRPTGMFCGGFGTRQSCKKLSSLYETTGEKLFKFSQGEWKQESKSSIEKALEIDKEWGPSCIKAGAARWLRSAARLLSQSNQQLFKPALQDRITQLLKKAILVQRNIGRDEISLPQFGEVKNEIINDLFRLHQHYEVGKEKTKDPGTKENIEKQQTNVSKQIVEEALEAQKIYSELQEDPGKLDPAWIRIRRAKLYATAADHSPDPKSKEKWYGKACDLAKEAWIMDPDRCKVEFRDRKDPIFSHCEEFNIAMSLLEETYRTSDSFLTRVGSVFKSVLG